MIATTPTPTGLAFHIHVTPRARRPGVGGDHDGALRVLVAEPAESGRANAACVKALAEALAVPRADVAIAAGSRSRRKRVLVNGDASALASRLEELAAASPKS